MFQNNILDGRTFRNVSRVSQDITRDAIDDSKDCTLQVLYGTSQ